MCTDGWLDLASMLLASTSRTRPGPSSNLALEHELTRWLAVNPRGDASSFRAGWYRLTRSVGLKLREWATRWWHAVGKNDRLRSRIGLLLLELAGRDDSG